MTTVSQRFLTEAQLSQPAGFTLSSRHQMGDKVWLWHAKDKRVEGRIQGVNFVDTWIITYDVAVEVQDSGLYLVTYGLRGGITKPGEAYPGDDGGLTKTEDTPYTSKKLHH